MLDLELSYYSEEIKAIAGADEAGRGPLAGPVVVAAVVLPRDYRNDAIDDSKKLTAKQRDALFEEIKSVALSYAIEFGSPEEIDKENIYACTQRLFRKCLLELQVSYQFALTDCMPLPDFPYPYEAIVKGDAKAQCIAAASILAKVTRDRYMEELGKRYPDFSFGVHKGYGTKKHLEELDRFGPIEGVHRKSFAPVKKFFSKQLTLF